MCVCVCVWLNSAKTLRSLFSGSPLLKGFFFWAFKPDRFPSAGQCSSSEFWNSDVDVCVPCESCKKYPKTPSCNTCKRLCWADWKCGRGYASADLTCVQSAGKSVDETPDVWKLAAIASFSVLAVVLVGAALIIGLMVHRRKSHKRPLRGENLCTRQFRTRTRTRTRTLRLCCAVGQRWNTSKPRFHLLEPFLAAFG